MALPFCAHEVGEDTDSEHANLKWTIINCLRAGRRNEQVA